MYRTVISQNYSDPAHKMIDNNRYGKGMGLSVNNVF